MYTWSARFSSLSESKRLTDKVVFALRYLAGHQGQQKLAHNANDPHQEVYPEDFIVDMVLQGKKLLRHQHGNAKVSGHCEENRQNRKKLELKQSFRDKIQKSLVQNVVLFVQLFIYKIYWIFNQIFIYFKLI